MKNRVRELRTGQGLSQGELAAALDVSRQTINSIEQERYTPSLPLALALARFFQTSAEAMFDGDAMPLFSVALGFVMARGDVDRREPEHGAPVARDHDRVRRPHPLRRPERRCAACGATGATSAFVAFIVEVARGHDGAPYSWLGALGGLSYLLAVVGLRLRG